MNNDAMKVFALSADQLKEASVAVLAALANLDSLTVDWQPITTAPREIECRCILGHKYSVVTGYWDGHGWRNERSCGMPYFEATHWKPLPAPPK